MIYAYLVVVGLCLGSFVNALVWRMRLKRINEDTDYTASEEQGAAEGSASVLRDMLPGMLLEIRDWLVLPVHAATWLAGRPKASKAAGGQRKEAEKYSIMTGRSMCPHCEHELAAKDLVPVFSWLFLRGKCRYCKAPISVQYPAVELATAFIFVASYIFWPRTLDTAGWLYFALWLLTATGLVALAVYDAKYRFLPNEILFPLLWVAVVMVVVSTVRNGPAVLLHTGLAVVTLWGLFFVIFATGERIGRSLMGYGDVRLAILLGILTAGPIHALLVIFFASVIGLLWTMPAILRKQVGGSSQLPFGPFLVAATFVIVLFGTSLVDWYMNTLVI